MNELESDAATTICSGRQVKIPIRFCETNNVQQDTNVEYGMKTAKVIAKHMCAFNEMTKNTCHKHHSYIQAYNLNAGLKQFGNKGHKPAICKRKQLHQRAIF